MQKFKVGDKVRIISCTFEDGRKWLTEYFYINKIGIIQDVFKDATYPYTVKIDEENENTFLSCDLKLLNKINLKLI